jgi:hypothetical protein
MRSLVVLIAAAALAVVAFVPAARGATACPATKSGKVAISKLRATKANCATAAKVGKRWAKGAQGGHCVPPNVKATAHCTVSGYKCRVTAQPTAVAPKELATCKRGARKLTWTAFFS